MNLSKIKRVIKCVLMFILSIQLFIMVSACSPEDREVPFDPVVSASMYMDQYDIHRMLEVILYSSENELMSDDEIISALEDLMHKMQLSDLYFNNSHMINTKLKGRTVGAVKNELGLPIGGGHGYPIIKGEYTYTVNNADQLKAAAAQAKSGDVIWIENGSKIDMTSLTIAENYTMVLNEGVTLASDRGVDGSLGGIIFTTAVRSKPLIEAAANVTISGVVIQGGDPNERKYPIPSKGAGVSVVGSGFKMENCEVSGFAFASVEILTGENHVISHNYIHHNRSLQSGYGIFVDDASVVIDSNLFNYNRISVLGSGAKNCSMEVTNNVEMGTCLDHAIQMNELKKGKEISSGDSLIIKNNTFFNDTSPVKVTVIPQNGITIADNYFGLALDEYDNSYFYGEESEFLYVVVFENNAYGLLEKIKTDEEKIDYLSLHTAEMKTTNIMSRLFFGDVVKVYGMVRDAYIAMDNKDENVKLTDVLHKAIRTIEQFEEQAYEYLDKPYVEMNGDIYGVIVDDNPLGGGNGYKDIITTGDYIVETSKELIQALMYAKSGEVIFVKGDAVIDLTTITASLIIPEGVTLASDRGYNNSPGALIYSDAFVSPMFTARGNVRITGLTLRGADWERRMDHHARAFSGTNAPGSTYFYLLKTINGIYCNSSNLTIDNCELSGFSHAAIYVPNGTGHHFHHNYMHHNQRHGLGYCVTHGTAYSVIEYNLLNANRHDLAATGAPNSGYVARHNLQLGTSLSHCFDVHGGRDRNDGTNIAGELILMHNNVFLSDQHPYWIRGIPTELQDFYNNIVYYPLEKFNAAKLYGANDAEKEKFSIRNNIFNAMESAVIVP